MIITFQVLSSYFDLMVKPKAILLALIALTFGQNPANSQIADPFDDLKVIWQGNTGDFLIQDGRLVSDSDQPNDTFYLSSRSEKLHEFVYWQLESELKFRTSSANYIDFVIASEQADLEGIQNGIFIRIGDTRDNLALYQMVQGDLELLLEGEDKSIDYASTRLKVALRIEDGQAQLLRLIDGVDQSWLIEGTTSLMIPQSWQYTGIKIRQSTPSFFGKHEFESFYAGPIIRDSLPPKLVHWHLESASVLVLEFDEELNPDKGVFSWNSATVKIADQQVLNNVVRLILNEPLNANEEFILSVKELEDTSNNVMPDTSFSVLRLEIGVAERYDILIHELMPKPEPVVGLQPYEYVELVNASEKWIQLSDLQLSDRSGGDPLPPYILRPDSIVVLFPVSARDKFTPYLNTLYVERLPSLNNSGDEINLRRTSDGTYIHGVNYSDETYGDEFKASGGWSLEMIDPGSPCLGMQNWTASVSAAGGSPGASNSVKAPFNNIEPPLLQSVYFDKEHFSLKLMFDQEVGPNMLTQPFRLVPPLEIDSVHFPTEKRNEIRINFVSAPDSGVLYSLSFDSLYGCKKGYRFPEEIQFGIPAEICSGCLLINEVLFNEKSGGSDYIELYNPTESLIDLEEVRMVLGRLDGSLIEVLDFTAENQLQIPPKSYLCVTENSENVRSFYDLKNEQALFEHSQSLRMNSDGGYISLKKGSGEMLDSLYFNEEMHHVLLNDFDGVSLERIHPETDVWTSASSLSGFGTPTYRNSQWKEIQKEEHKGEMSLNPRIISPDGDGMNDLLELSFNLLPDSRLTVKVFDLNGKEIHTLLNNAPVGAISSIFWDGRDGSGKVPAAGIYVVLAEGFEPSGQVFRFKGAVSLTYP
jgi:hypothetical protein